MIYLTKLSGETFALNPDMIETIEERPDTTIQLVDKKLLIVKERMAQIVDQVAAHRKGAVEAAPQAAGFIRGGLNDNGR